MALVETTKSKELFDYWEDCQRLREWSEHPDLVASFFDELVPARLREARTLLGIAVNYKLLAQDPRSTTKHENS